MSAPNCSPPPASTSRCSCGNSMELQVLRVLVEELSSVVGSRQAVEAEIASRYQSRIAELEEENQKLVKDANDALLIRETVASLNPIINEDEALDGQPMTEDSDVSPILEQRIQNLQYTVERVRQRARKKEKELTDKMRKLEMLAMTNMHDIMGAVTSNVEQPILGEAESKGRGESVSMKREEV